MKSVPFYPYVVRGEKAEEAANALDKAIHNLDYLYSAAPSGDGYTEARMKILADVARDYDVKII